MSNFMMHLLEECRNLSFGHVARASGPVTADVDQAFPRKTSSWGHGPEAHLEKAGRTWAMGWTGPHIHAAEECCWSTSLSMRSILRVVDAERFDFPCLTPLGAVRKLSSDRIFPTQSGGSTGTDVSTGAGFQFHRYAGGGGFGRECATGVSGD